MKFNYDSKLEAFVREDGLGKKYWVNMNEAQRVMTLWGLGYNPNQISAKIHFNNSKFTVSSIKNFIAKVESGDIVIDMDAPAPAGLFEELSLESRVAKLENDLQEFKVKYLMHETCDCESKESLTDKVRGLFNYG